MHGDTLKLVVDPPYRSAWYCQCDRYGPLPSLCAATPEVEMRIQRRIRIQSHVSPYPSQCPTLYAYAHVLIWATGPSLTFMFAHSGRHIGSLTEGVLKLLFCARMMCLAVIGV